MLLKSAIRLARLHCRQSPRSAALVTLGRHALERKHPHARELVKAVSVVVELMSDNLQQGSDHTTLKKASFAQTLKLKALRVQAKQCQSLMKKFAGYMQCCQHWAAQHRVQWVVCYFQVHLE